MTDNVWQVVADDFPSSLLYLLCFEKLHDELTFDLHLQTQLKTMWKLLLDMWRKAERNSLRLSVTRLEVSKSFTVQQSHCHMILCNKLSNYTHTFSLSLSLSLSLCILVTGVGLIPASWPKLMPFKCHKNKAETRYKFSKLKPKLRPPEYLIC